MEWVGGIGWLAEWICGWLMDGIGWIVFMDGWMNGWNGCVELDGCVCSSNLVVKATDLL